MTHNEITRGDIVAAVDGSSQALDAVRWAAEQAQLEGRPLVLVHVMSSPDPVPSTLRTVGYDDEYAWTDEPRRASDLILDAATSVAKATSATLDVRGCVIPGTPRKVLPAISESAHLLVMGARGRGAVRSRLMGSVSVHVAKTASCPVVVVRPGSRPGWIKDGVIVAADGTAECRPVMEFAFRQASVHGVPLTAMHCVAEVAAGVAGARATEVPDLDEEQHHRLLARSVAGLREEFPDVPVTQEVSRGLVKDCLAAHPRPWNLVVVGRHPVTGLRWLAGSTATDVMERWEGALAVIPESEPVPR
jgi:nucleotide-binding universal stress UspA family protein